MNPASSTPARRLLPDQVRDALLARIQGGALPVGARIPAEPELCQEFGVSRATVREAVRSLVEAGYLTRVQGSGTYVAFSPKLQHTLDRNLSYTKLITEAGYRPKRRVLTIEHLPLDNEEAKALDTRSEARGVRIERVRSADDRPVIYSIDVIPERYVREATTEDLSGSLYRLFGVMGHTVAHGEAVISPVVAISPMAEWLKVDHGSPLLHIRQVDYSTAGDAMMFSREWHVPGIFELSLLRRAT